MFNFLKNIFYKNNHKSTKNLKVIENFNIKKFEGVWYEIARYDNFFEKDYKNISAEYTIINENKFRIENFGILNDDFKSIKGFGKYKDKNNKNIGWLKISFFRPFYFDYKILYVDEKYENIIVTGSTTEFFWILSKNKTINKETYSNLIKISNKFGFEESKMIFN